jgi:hypothetical protein
MRLPALAYLVPGRPHPTNMNPLFWEKKIQPHPFIDSSPSRSPWILPPDPRLLPSPARPPARSSPPAVVRPSSAQIIVRGPREPGAQAARSYSERQRWEHGVCLHQLGRPATGHGSAARDMRPIGRRRIQARRPLRPQSCTGTCLFVLCTLYMHAC